MRRRKSLSKNDEVRLNDVCPACPDIARAREIAQRFTALVRDRTGHLLPDWISDAERDAPQPIRGFARFMKFDIDAVTVGLTLQYSSGVVEGARQPHQDDRAADVRPSLVPRPESPHPHRAVVITDLRAQPKFGIGIRGAGHV
ncbi:hypothetical protein [Streptomyces sp. NRRL F-2580]|uniref:hypothetical protein n=1 Tax=Streptomyces sp. NRRL F-2580 TaxID=1463841 RepID=UPI000D13F224|nr:hypothetical protein [Streptomyces sp. NRRL F-2580]